jgi:hypothetical protein
VLLGKGLCCECCVLLGRSLCHECCVLLGRGLSVVSVVCCQVDGCLLRVLCVVR